MLKSKNGITLVALVMTIIILLILAGISISSLTDNGLFGKAKEADEKHNQAVANEQSALQDYLDVLKVNDPNDSALDGQGTEAEPYVIKSIEDLVLFAYDVNQGKDYQGKYVKLEKDLDFKLDESYENPYRTNYATYGYDGELKTLLTTGEGFKPIGTTKNNDNTGNSFFGIFDGNGKTISNLRINKESNIVTDIGLFTSNSGEIKNLGIKDCNINIKSSENINKYWSCGVICGYNYGKIDNCWTSGNIKGIYDVETNVYFGGIAGGGSNKINSEASITNCYNKTNINAVMNSTGSMYIGGIIAGKLILPVSNCYNLGNISGEQKGTSKLSVGGVVGNGSGMIDRCYNIGKIEGKQPDSMPRVGGISGGCGDAEYICNVGEIIYEGTSTKYVGTLLGLTEGTVSNSYTLTNETLNGIGRNYSSTPEPTKVDTVAEMPTILEIVGEGFKEDTNNINNGYPILTWQ